MTWSLIQGGNIFFWNINVTKYKLFQCSKCAYYFLQKKHVLTVFDVLFFALTKQ